jgi:hypothetical protein
VENRTDKCDLNQFIEDVSVNLLHLKFHIYVVTRYLYLEFLLLLINIFEPCLASLPPQNPKLRK